MTFQLLLEPKRNLACMEQSSRGVAIDVGRVSKNYGEVEALSDVTLSIADQEFFTLLGPSGCGKTTLLRIIAGFETVSVGNIKLYGEEIRDLPANKRPVNTVFQQYSLFPHMTVEENIKFGLQMLGRDNASINQRTQQMLDLVQLGEFAKRKSTQLSGGQQQRVALARALAPEPKVLLLDEPLSALDLKLRQAMRTELKQIQQETGVTFVFVTHDQEEALTMSDRIAVMSNGKVQQVGTAESIYCDPKNMFVADFIGEINMLPATLTGTEDGLAVCQLANGTSVKCRDPQTSAGGSGQLCIRPERLTITSIDHSLAELKGCVVRSVYLGTDTQISVRVDTGEDVLVRVQNSSDQEAVYSTGDQVGLIVDHHSIRFLDS